MPRSGLPRPARAAKSALSALSALALLAAPAAGEAYRPDLQLSGACSQKSFLNGLLFKFQGTTASGAPYYKASTRDEYLYWDPDCGGGGDGTPRWILDNNKPDTTALRDLDRDGQCEYHARIDSAVSKYTPETDFWYMDCGGVQQKKLLSLITITTTMTTTSTTVTSTTVTTTKTTTTRTTTSTTKTTTTRTTTSSTKTSTTRTETSTTGTSTTITSSTTTSMTSTTRTTSTSTTTLMVLKLTGACPYKDFLNGLTFVEEGYSASGARWFKANEAEQYLYYDYDCNGGGNGKRRWIIDNSMPFPQHVEDLDQDGACNYHARLDSMDLNGPPHAATWQVWCGIGWTDAVLHLDDDRDFTYNDGSLDHSQSLRVRGAFDSCPEKAWMDGLQFDYVGDTAAGSPYYMSQTLNQYIYFDYHCSGNPLGSSRWIIDEDKPSTVRPFDLDGDFNCSYHARVKSTDIHIPPKGAMWKIDCGGQWKDLWLAMIRLPMTTTTVTTTVTTQAPATTTKARATAKPKAIVNSAAGAHPLLALTVLVAWVHMRG